jgi:hypothetical protein
MASSVKNGFTGSQGADGHYWSSTRFDTHNRFSAYASNGGFNPAYNYRRDHGFSLRCVKTTQQLCFLLIVTSDE